MSRYTHNRAGAVAHQHVIRDPDRNAFFVSRIDCECSGEGAGLFLGKISAFEIRFRGNLGPISFDRFTLLFCRDLIDEWVFRRDHHVGRAIKCVGSGGEYADAPFRFPVSGFRNRK